MSTPQIVVNVVRFGEKEEISLEDGATRADVLAKLGEDAEGLDLKSGGEDLRATADKPVAPGETITAAPKSVKQG